LTKIEEKFHNFDTTKKAMDICAKRMWVPLSTSTQDATFGILPVWVHSACWEIRCPLKRQNNCKTQCLRLTLGGLSWPH